MADFTYEWKVDFALVLSAISMLSSFAVWIFDKRRTRKIERIRAYEEIYEDACFIFEFPLRKRENIAKQIQYMNDNPDIQNAVRTYLNLHWPDQMWGIKKFVPPSLKSESEKLNFVVKIREEASKFQDMLHSQMFDIALAERSPVFYWDESEIKERMAKIMKHVGQRFSLFSSDIQSCWESAKFKDPLDIKHEYEKAIAVCKNYFDHNRRDFDDPFFDLVEKLKREYLSLIRQRKERILWAFQRYFWRIKHPIRFLKSLKKSNT